MMGTTASRRTTTGSMEGVKRLGEDEDDVGDGEDEVTTGSGRDGECGPTR